MANIHAKPTSTLTLPSDTELLIERVFRAPRPLVWRAFTDPALLRKWMGPAEHPMTRCEMDVRVGGKMLWVWGEGAHSLPAEFLEVDPPRRLVYVDTGVTPSHITLTFTEAGDGVTKVAMLGRLSTKALRDEILATGYSEGMEFCYAQLDALLPAL